MRIGYIGNFSKPWCTEVHVTASLRALGHEVVELQENRVDFDRLQPHYDLLMWTRTWDVDDEKANDALLRFRRAHVPSCSFHLDRFHGLDREYLIGTEAFFRTDVLFTPDDGPWEDYGVEHVWLPPAVFDRECGRVERQPRRWPWQVVFVGSHPYPHREWEPTRTALLHAFHDEFGKAFAVLPTPGRPLRGRALQSLYATVPVVLGDSCLVGNPKRYWSDRIPETLGRGGFLIHPNVDGLDEWYVRNADLMTFDVGDTRLAVDIAREALAAPEERARIAAHGQATVLGRDTYVHRMQTVLDRMASRPAALDERQYVGGRTHVALHGWSAVFDPRDLDIAGADFVTVAEVWDRNDYRIPEEGLSGTVLDVGANVGAFSVLAAKAGAECVVAVEPQPDNFARLAHHVAENGCEQVVLLNLAVTAPGVGRVQITGQGGGAQVSLLPVETLDPSMEPWVDTVTLDALIDKYAPISLLKMDIEGGEFPIFAALDVRQLAYVERIAMEWHGPASPHLSHLRGDEFGPLVATLADAGRVETFGHPSRGGLLYWTRY